MKNILVTGVSRSLGLTITEHLLKNDYAVYGISRKKTDSLKKLEKDYPDTFKWTSFDLEDSEGVKDQIFKNFLGFDTPVHGIVNNAAMAYDDIVTNLDLEQLQNMYKINVFTPMNITKYAIRHMLLHNIKGSIVHLSSISVHTGYKGLAMYASSKGALEAFSKNTAREWGEKGIRSNCIVAGFMETDMNAALDKSQKDRIYRRTSLKAPTTKSSVAHMAEFLLSDASESITGQNLHVDAGTI